MSKLPIIKTKELIRVLEKLGFFKHHQVGSHAQYKDLRGRRITVPIHAGKDIKKKILRGIISDLEMTVDDFIKFLKK
ncbi:MAG: type II toxin-antitoxin system HicA family toxin [Candidatus Sungbacteria bacterium]|nr:type II toxin-antitoxin system HicA family toxin [Candidatus Sungbacteria bacterium]